SFLYAAASTAIYTLSLHDALPILLIGLSYVLRVRSVVNRLPGQVRRQSVGGLGDLSDFPAHIGRAVTRIDMTGATDALDVLPDLDRKSTRLNSSHVKISYAVFCLK